MLGEADAWQHPNSDSFINAFQLREGDCIGICQDGNGRFMIECDTPAYPCPAVRSAALDQSWGRKLRCACQLSGSGAKRTKRQSCLVRDSRQSCDCGDGGPSSQRAEPGGGNVSGPLREGITGSPVQIPVMATAIPAAAVPAAAVAAAYGQQTPAAAASSLCQIPVQLPTDTLCPGATTAVAPAAAVAVSSQKSLDALSETAATAAVAAAADARSPPQTPRFFLIALHLLAQFSVPKEITHILSCPDLTRLILQLDGSLLYIVLHDHCESIYGYINEAQAQAHISCAFSTG